MTKVITYGTFDMLHFGHIRLLERAKSLGDYLIVAVSTDEFNCNEKQKECYFTYEERKALVESMEYLENGTLFDVELRLEDYQRYKEYEVI